MAAEQVDALVIFGATGDLAKLETFPALVGLVERGVLDVPVVGAAKSGWDIGQFRDYAAQSLRNNGIDPDSAPASAMLALLRYVDGDLEDPATYTAMSEAMGEGKRALFYLEVPPFLFGRIAEGISTAGRAEGARVMVEKPFGTDLDGAIALNATMYRYFPEDAIYRVDHWLGLDALNDVLVARFANSTIEPLLNRDHVESVQITMAEAFDVADRGRFYDSAGAIRDVVQNHMLQVLATVLADPPDGSGPDSWLDAKARVISALRPLSPADAVRGQYDGYLDVEGVKAQHRPARHEVAHCAHEHDGAVVPVRLAQQSLEVDGLHGAVPFNEQVLYGARWVTRHRIVGEETVDVHLSAPVDQNVLPRPADERRDRYRAQVVGETVEVDQQQADARGHGGSGHRDADVRDEVFADPAQQREREDEGACERRQHRLLQPVAVPQAHVPGRQRARRLLHDQYADRHDETDERDIAPTMP